MPCSTLARSLLPFLSSPSSSSPLSASFLSLSLLLFLLPPSPSPSHPSSSSSCRIIHIVGTSLCISPHPVAVASPFVRLRVRSTGFGFLPEYRMHIYSASLSFYPACRYRPVPCFPHRCCSFGVRCDEHAHAKMNPRTRHISPFSASHRLPLSSCFATTVTLFLTGSSSTSSHPCHSLTGTWVSQ